MKRAFCILMTAMCMLSVCSCGKSAENEHSEPDRKNEVITNESVLNAEVTDEQEKATSEAEIYTSDNTDADEMSAIPAETTEAVMDESKPAETEIQYIITVLEGYTEMPQTTKVVTQPNIDTENTEPAEGAFGAEGRTQDQWLSLGQELYMEGCELAFRYLCTGSEFPIDRENLDIIDRTYFLTTYTSFEEATMPYYELFSKSNHGEDFNGLLLEQDGRLYAARAARGMDVTYLSSEVTELVSVTNTEVRYKVLVEYEEGTQEHEFTLVPEDGFWKIGEFTLPY
ncbi:MAG: hypothetical protein J6B17_00680 [Ruminococcus sp.]|nr:hypothetical protein [Ruminococcus sp.]